MKSKDVPFEVLASRSLHLLCHWDPNFLPPIHSTGWVPLQRCFAPKAMGTSGMLTENRNEITKNQFETTFANKGFEKSLHHLTLNDCTFHNLKPSKSSACGTKEMDSRSFFRSISPTFTPRERLATWSGNSGDTESAHG